jgi:ribosomal protein S18 acetylase RimI-like enzyme
MSELFVRQVSAADDLEALAELTVSAYAAGGALDPAGSYMATLRNTADRASQAQLLIAEDAGATLGTVTVTPPDSPWAEIARPAELEFRFLAVAPTAQGRGIGAALVDAVVQMARERNDSAVVLSVLDSNFAGRNLYQRLGFVHVPERDWVPWTQVNLLVYSLRLD